MRLYSAELYRAVAEWAGRWPEGDEDLRAVAALVAAEEAGAVEHGRHVVARTKDLQAFIRRWREHFLRTMQPRFLPEHWNVDRPASRDET